MDYTNDVRSLNSRFASLEEIKTSLYRIAADEANPAYGGLPLYADKDAVYVEKDDTHTLVFGLTGSKKTRLIAMPALQMFAIAGESFIASDPKGELYKKTYPLLKERGYKTVVINLRDPKKSNAWNPLRIPYLQYNNGQKDKAVEFVLDLAKSITATSGHSQDYWEMSGANMLAGLILILFENAKEDEINFRSLRALRTQAFKMENGETPYIQENFLKHIDKSSFICSLLSGTAEVTENTRSCIISIFDHAMSIIFSQDCLINMLSGSDFNMCDIGKTKTAVFLITPDENTVYNKLISVFVKQCYGELLREAENHKNNWLPTRVNFLLDEFANLPAINDFPAMITASRSRNIRFNLFLQSQNQLFDRYGHQAETIKGNCENWIFLHSRDYSLLNEIVNLSGTKSADTGLISTSMLQTLDKKKGEAFIFNKRLHPYIAALWDIDKYPHTAKEGQAVQYPENSCKADAVFDFQDCCDKIKANHFLNDDNKEPIFTSHVPADSELEKADNEEVDDEEDTPDSVQELTLEKYGPSVGEGWNGILAPIFREINLFNKENKGDEIEIRQIKEKYGTLRFHASNCPDYIEGMISAAEEESEHICEICGTRGETVEIDGWYSTLCPRHAKANKAAGQDYKLASRLYRKFMDTYERGRWSGSYNPVIKKMLMRNLFVTKEKVNGILRAVRLKREKERTDFYAETEKKFVKHEIYVQWSENNDKTLHDGYWHVMKGDEIITYWILERETAEREAAKEIFSRWGKDSKMELVRMVGFNESLTFPQCAVQKDSGDYWKFVKDYLVKNNIKMTGAEHQKYGIPLIENNGSVYAFTLSYEKWGRLMAEAFDPENTDESAYMKWAGERPKGEKSWVNPDME